METKASIAEKPTNIRKQNRHQLSRNSKRGPSKCKPTMLVLPYSARYTLLRGQS